jgi:hypothetical protein
MKCKSQSGDIDGVGNNTGKKNWRLLLIVLRHYNFRLEKKISIEVGSN